MAFAPLKRFHYFFIACLAVKFFFVLFAFLKTITGPLDDAVVAATLLSYTYGFQRRSLAGTIFLFFSGNPVVLTFCIKAVFLVCTLILFVLFVRPLRKHAFPAVVLLLLFFIDSPFAFGFYKIWWLSKEFLFFPLIGVFLLSFRMNSAVFRLLVWHAVIVTGLLIHEAFVFLVLPFLLACCLLHGEKIRNLFMLPATACLVLFSIKYFSVPPEPAVSRYIAEARHLGFAISDQFMAPLIYMRTGLPALFQMGFRSFQQPINWIYAILYLIQWGFLYLVYTTFRGQLLIENARSLLYSLLFIHLGALPLYLLATDYGRWSSFTFIMALLLIVRQVSFSGGLSGLRNPWIYRALLIGLPLFFLLIRIPLYTVSHQNSLLNYLKEFTIYSKVAGFRY